MSPLSLSETHKALYGQDPTEKQELAYKYFNEKNLQKLMVCDKDPEVFEASFTIAFRHTFVTETKPSPTTVFLYVKNEDFDYYKLQLETIVRKMIILCKRQKNVEKCNHIGELLNSIFLLKEEEQKPTSVLWFLLE